MQSRLHDVYKHLGGMAGADAIPFLRNIIQACAL
jgi:hypothetical protein